MHTSTSVTWCNFIITWVLHILNETAFYRISIELRGKMSEEGNTQRHIGARIGCSKQGMCKVYKRTSC